MCDEHHAMGELSMAGAARAEAMLGSLQRELVLGAQRRRRARRAGVVLGMLAVVLGGVYAITLPRQSVAPAQAPAAPVVASAPSAPVGPVVEVVRTGDALPKIPRVTVDAGAVRAMKAAPGRISPEVYLTDSELLALLEEIGRPSGLAKSMGRVWLTAAVTDEELARGRRGG